MSDLNLPLLLESDALQPLLGSDDLLVIDLSRSTTHSQAHIPGAIFLDYGRIIAMQKPVMGLLPSEEELTTLFSALGIGSDTHVVAYDDEGGGKAGRLIWTLEVMGHNKASLLNGGLHAWANEGFPITQELTEPSPGFFTPNPTSAPVADTDYILGRMNDPDVALLDARSPDEYRGIKRFAEKGGHIPGAVNLDWVMAMDQGRNLRMKPADELKTVLADMGVTPDKEVITYCQTHHRSSYTYIILKALGYPRVKGYPGSWSAWGNHDETPVA
ncbi:MAG: sulfurtransferase [Candidatus Sedimenticola sp. 6PFRAG7]